MRRIALLLFVGLMASSTSGVLDLLAPEPCAITESAQEDGACATTCVRCHCGAPLLSLAPPELQSMFSAPRSFEALAVALPSGTPFEILHVPLVTVL